MHSTYQFKQSINRFVTGGAVMGLGVVGLAVLGLGGLFIILKTFLRRVAAANSAEIFKNN